MTPKQKNYKYALIKSIHSSSMYKDVYSDDRELYEMMLKSRFGVSSSKDMGIEELIKLDNFMHKRDGLIIAPKKVNATSNQISFITTLWDTNSRNKDLHSLLKQIKKVIKRDINQLKDLSKKEAGQVIASIKNIKPPVMVNNIDYKPKG